MQRDEHIKNINLKPYQE